MVRFIASLAIMTAAVLTVAGCGGSKAESSVENVTSAFNELADRLARITTREQFVAAEPDIRKIGEKLKAAMQQMKVLETLPADENDRIGQTLGPKMAEARRRALEEANRISTHIDPLADQRIEDMLDLE